MDRITYHSSPPPEEACKYSIIIPTWNNLPQLKLCIRSIQQNSHFLHQIILHVNEGADGTLAWAKSAGFDFTYTKTNAGVCWALNACRSLVKTDYMVYMNDDMYVLPDWDLALWREVDRLPDHYFFLSSTMIEPVPTSHGGILSPYNYGRDPGEFDEARLLAEYKALPAYDWAGATWPPNIVHKDIWDLVGGYSIEYFPGMYSDPDFSMKLLKAGVTHFKGVGRSLVYHFGSKTTGRVKKNHGSRQFLNKWGMTSSTMVAHLLNRGEPFTGPLTPGNKTRERQLEKIRSRIKRILLSFLGTGQSDEW